MMPQAQSKAWNHGNTPMPSRKAMKSPSLRIFCDTYREETGHKATAREIGAYYDANREIFKKECGGRK